jgi:hypothetical protein
MHTERFLQKDDLVLSQEGGNLTGSPARAISAKAHREAVHVVVQEAQLP